MVLEFRLNPCKKEEYCFDVPILSCLLIFCNLSSPVSKLSHSASCLFSDLLHFPDCYNSLNKEIFEQLLEIANFLVRFNPHIV